MLRPLLYIFKERSPTGMPDQIYEVIAQGARYWFLFLMVLIVWRSWRWYRKDRRAARKRLKLLPDAGFIGEMVVIEGGGVFDRGDVFPIPREGTLGFLRTNDLCIPVKGVENSHLWFCYEERKGLMVTPFGKNAALVDGEAFENARNPLCMAHGSYLTVGDVQLRLRLFAGFESMNRAPRRADFADEPQPMPPQQPQQQPQQPQPMTEQERQLMWQQWQMQQQYLQQQAYQQGYQQAMAQQQPAEPVYYPEESCEEPYAAPGQPWDDDPDELPYDMAQIAREEGLVDNSIFMRPADQSRPVPPQETVYFEPVYDDEPEEDDYACDDLPPARDFSDEDMTDAAAPPRSAYVGHDESARAKRAVWDKYFGGGQQQ